MVSSWPAFFTRYSRRKRLVRKTHIHHRGGWPSAAARLIKRPSPSTNTLRPSLQGIFLDEVARRAACLWRSSQAQEINFHVEVAGIGDDRAVLHLVEMFLADDMNVAGHGDENIADRARLRAIGITSKPSITASKAFMGSISVTMTSAPRPLARMATPRPHQP